ncbi:hypothetical protein PT276_10585 [Orbaceae bacterium ESL0721]|nr:hypothetical protein [Orbaceae bacterium ESL0721]
MHKAATPASVICADIADIAHLDAYKAATPASVICADIADIAMENASMVVLNFTLQFLNLKQDSRCLIRSSKL